MKIKRFYAPDMRQTLRKVRDTLGADAVILSNKRVDGGVEIVAAVDYDESLLDGGIPDSPVQGSATAEERAAAEDDIRYGRNISPAPQLKTAAPNQVEDPALKKMQSELRSLRGLLVNQMSGMAWQNEVQSHPLRAHLLQRLMALGLSPALSRKLVEQAGDEDDLDHHWRLALGQLAHLLPIADANPVDDGGIVAVVGATGVGKTTSIAKLAARYILRHGKRSVGLVTTDNYRVAAQEQLRSYARIMEIPMRVASDMQSMSEVISHFQDKDLILVDTAGMSQRDMRLNEQLALLQAGGKSLRVFLTLAANAQRGVLNDVARSFKTVPLAGCILSKLDETISLGGALSVAVENHLPIAYFSDGQRVPEDFHPARAHTLVSRAVAIMQQSGVGAKQDSISLTIGGMVAHAHG